MDTGDINQNKCFWNNLLLQLTVLLPHKQKYCTILNTFTLVVKAKPVLVINYIWIPFQMKLNSSGLIIFVAVPQ